MGLGCRYCLLNNELHKFNAFLSRHYWFTVSLKSIHNSYLSCRPVLDSSENPFKTQAGRRWETQEAVGENRCDRKWKGERSSQSFSIPAKVYQAVARSEVMGFCMASTAVCNEESTNLPQHDPRSHCFHWEPPITHMGLIPTSRQVSRQNRGPPSILFVCHALTSS